MELRRKNIRRKFNQKPCKPVNIGFNVYKNIIPQNEKGAN
nr:MAG TPA: hypothetical protein [Caudoviricetes sp.]